MRDPFKYINTFIECHFGVSGYQTKNIRKPLTPLLSCPVANNRDLYWNNNLCNVLNIVLLKKKVTLKKKRERIPKTILNSEHSAQGKYKFKHNACLIVPSSL